MYTRTIAEQPSFVDFVRHDPACRRYLIIALPAIFLQLVLFKLFYPFAGFFFTDSFGYLYAAGYNLDVHIWPIGYSKFLRVFNSFVHSDTGLVCCQYLFLQGSGLTFLFTLFYLFRPSKLVSVILFVGLLFNPWFLYLGNSVSSDALFIGASLCWISLLLRMIACPSRSLIFSHAILLALLFTVRYTAIYYPLVAGLAILLSAYTRKEKAVAIAFPLLLVSGFIFYTAHAIEEMTGIRTFSPFSGWQLANNALYMYGHTRAAPAGQASAPVILLRKGSPPVFSVFPPGFSDHPPATPSRFAELDGRIRRYFDTARKERTLLDSDYPGIYYMWDRQSPLAGYRTLTGKKDNQPNDYKNWVTRSVLYSDYGGWLISHHPMDYAQYYCLPNLQRYAFPPLEFMGKYNSGMDTVEKLAVTWFHYKDQQVRALSPTVQAYILTPYQVLNMLLNLFWLGMLSLFLTTRKVRKAHPVFFRQMMVAGAVWIIHLCFSVLSAPVVLRYQVFPMILVGAGALLIAERLAKTEAQGPGRLLTGQAAEESALNGISVRFIKKQKIPS